MIAYLDTSVVLRVLFRQPGAVESWGRWNEVWSSELLAVEARRAIDRMRLLSALNDEEVARAHEELARIEQSIGVIGLTPAVLRRASGPMPTVVRTLDAVHLASALLFRETAQEELVFATHDRKQSVAARALGFRCEGRIL